MKDHIKAFCFLFVILSFSNFGEASLVNIQILGQATDSAGKADPVPASFTGAAAIGAAGDHWNGVWAKMYNMPLTIKSPLAILESDGKTRTNLRIRLVGFISADSWPKSDGAPLSSALLNSYLVCQTPASIIIKGLTPNSKYDLYLYGNNSRAGSGAKFSIDGDSPQSTQGNAGDVFAKGVDYVEFKNIDSGSSGIIEIQVQPGAGGIGIFNGLQISGSFAPFSPQTEQTADWGIKVWLKADDLARAGLKPGQPVKEWKDAFWGVRFSPDPKPPYNDSPPTYVEVNIPGSPEPVSAVKFDGTSSLRQLDLLDVRDEELTAFAVFLPRSSTGGGWKKLFAKRDGLLCLYEGGIATALNPKLYFTAYNENGICLGSKDTLPLALTGHQNEFESAPRFTGLLAEVIVFAKPLAAGDEQREITQAYLDEKYFSNTGQILSADLIPWPKKQINPTSTNDEAIWPKPQEKGRSYGVFSLTNANTSKFTEFAAGEVNLPFRFSLSISNAPRPKCLDFPGQPNPDCTHVFVRIDGELWMFRIDWIAEKGRPARYKGPDIDHMTRVEDGTYPPEVGLGWFLGGMWYDETERKLYAPLHIEQEGSHRFHPAGGWFSRKIGLATSVDKGKTWKYVGDIITPETYFYTHDVYKFSGSYNGNGVCDFGFYVDKRNGYFYIYPEESWYIKGQWGAMWGVRAARCAIADKMAPGKWNYFYNGRWDQPALGGKSSIVAPSHFWGFMYSTYLKKYICVFPTCKDPWWGEHSYNVDGVMIGSCTDLAKQDWVWAYCPQLMFGFNKLFNAEGTDTETCGKSFRFYSYFAENSYQRCDIELQPGQQQGVNFMPRFMFEPHPESSDPILSRKTKIVGSSHKDVIYTGRWLDKSNPDSFEGRYRESQTPDSTIEFSFTGSEIYWRAIRSPASGIANVYIDGVFRKTVDCFSPQGTAYEVFTYAYLSTGLDSNAKHTIKIVVKGCKNPESKGTAIGHIGFEYSAESYKASAGSCSIMGKNNWYYQQKQNSKYSDMQFIPRDDIYVKDWFGIGNARIGGNYQIADANAASVRRWIAPHGGTVRVEGTVIFDANNAFAARALLLHNTKQKWSAKPGQSDSHDILIDIKQGGTIDFVVEAEPAKTVQTKTVWDPVITYTKSVSGNWKPNVPSPQNLAFGRSARSKILAYAYEPFNAVDGNSATVFAIYPDDKLSSGDDWLMLDLEKKYLIDRYVLKSSPKIAGWRPDKFQLQKSDDGFVWTDVDTVSGNSVAVFKKDVRPFAARFVRLYMPKGKPFQIDEFELYYVDHE